MKYDLWTFAEEEQESFLGTDIGTDTPIIVIELDEWSKRLFYNKRFAPLCIKESDLHFQIIIHSIDDSILDMTWEKKSMDIPSYEARTMLEGWLKRTNYFVNLAGIETYCKIFGKFKVEYN